jgi:hypothetical protein
MMFKEFRRGKEFPSQCFGKENKNTESTKAMFWDRKGVNYSQTFAKGLRT